MGNLLTFLEETETKTDIIFPHLGIALRKVGSYVNVFGIKIMFYGIVIGLAMIIGYLMAEHMAKRTGQNPEPYLDFTIIAVIVAILCMLIYIRIRFKDFRFGFSSVLALVHDVLVVLAFYAAARVSVSNTFVACMLTIVGYSINATIVIFDRVRENMANAGKSDIVAIVNKSVTQTLSRSIFTSLTTFVMVALLYVMGVSSIKDFALPLMVGIGCGCYSSVCLAGAFWVILIQKFPAKAKKK